MQSILGASQKHFAELESHPPESSALTSLEPSPEFAQLGSVFGIEGSVVSEVGSLKESLRSSIEHCRTQSEPVLIDYRCI